MTPIIGAAVASFLLGASLVGYFVWRSDNDATEEVSVAAPQLSSTNEDTTATATPSPSPSAEASEASDAAAGAVEAVERVAEQQGGIDQRLAAAEQRLARLDLQAQAAAGNAARAEGLLIAFASRRAIERGAELGYLADQLRLRFGDALPNAVRTIISFSRDPLTQDQLLARLEGLGPTLTEGQRQASWEELRRELSELFTFRRESTPSPAPERRLERARQFLESGRTDAAIAEIENMPGAESAQSWLADARRYRDAMDALERIETAAVLEPRLLRDGAGNSIDQLSPADGGSE
ncbi:hypothetical protein SAMN06297468_2207 [Altererythrobacter xiamenensis]|uniref:Inner membrane protein n=1 Tax=Altererythrobacter xiamenensis TaxID=1316679 RepID=A0A1Y6FJU4_9SPHN|nr:MICOS complex subunit MIC60 [Altererythrobacter xiamenensis]SMQ73480.1 hypothetical protein SAMN06297468_2207 [Altererythrobacter xiamenensis]